MALVANALERPGAFGCQQKSVHGQHRPGGCVGGQAGRQPTVRLASRLVVGQHDGASQITGKQQVDRSDARRKLSRQAEHRQILERRLPIGRQLGVVAAAQVRRAQRGQCALQPVGLLAGHTQRFSGLLEARRGLVLRVGRGSEAIARARQTLVEVGSFRRS